MGHTICPIENAERPTDMARNSVFNSIGTFFGDIGRARNASNLYSELSGMSDDALKARGLSRDGLPSYAFERAFNSK